jgi:hypothetical protein
MKKQHKLLTDKQWMLIEPLLPKPRQRRDKRDGHQPRIEHVSRAYSGFRKPVPHGDFCPTSFHPPRLAGDDCSIGKRRVPGSMPGGLCLAHWMSEDCSNGTDPLDGSFAPAKGGPRSQQTQARQGNEVDCTGRRSRSSDGSSAGKCLPEGS